MKSILKQIVHIRSVRFYLGCFLAFMAFAINLLAYNKPSVGLIFAAMFFVIGMIRIPETMLSRHTLVVIYTVWVAATAFVTLAMSQFCLNETLPEKGLVVTLLGILLIVALFLFPVIITLKIRITTIIISAVLVIFTCINYFVFLYRGSEIAPADILAIATAGNVAAEYSFRIPSVMCYALTLCVIYYFTAYAFPSLVINKRKRVRFFGGIIAIICACIVWFGGIGIKPLHWLQTGSVMNGYLFNFVTLLRDSFPNKPNDYSIDRVNSIVSHLVRPTLLKDDSPDIIVVMDESYANFDVLGDILNTDVRSLRLLKI